MSKQNLVGGTMLDVFMRTVRMKSRTETLAGALTLTALDPPLQFLDNGGSARTVTLPAEALSDGLCFIVANTGGGANIITVEDDATGLVASLAQNEHALCFCDGTTWLGLVGLNT